MTVKRLVAGKCGDYVIKKIIKIINRKRRFSASHSLDSVNHSGCSSKQSMLNPITVPFRKVQSFWCFKDVSENLMNSQVLALVL